VTWKLARPVPGARLIVRPLLSGRDYHATHHENGAFRFEPERAGDLLVWRPYDGVPHIVSCSNGSYHHEPIWYRDFLYQDETARGLDDSEDLASPGILTFDIGGKEAFWILGAGAPDAILPVDKLRASERRRRARLGAPLERAADSFIVRR